MARGQGRIEILQQIFRVNYFNISDFKYSNILFSLPALLLDAGLSILSAVNKSVTLSFNFN